MTPTTPRRARNRPLRTLSLAPSTWARLDEMATRTERSRSAMIEALILAAEMPRRKGGET
jgi:hypothetical protein